MEDKIYGKNTVLEALKGNISINKIFIYKNIHKDKKIFEIINLAREKKIPIQFVEKEWIDRESNEKSQGILAYISPIRYHEWEDILNSINFSRDFIVVLDHVQDPQNLGSAIRTSEFGGAKALVIPKVRSAQVSSSVFKASSGALSYLPIVRVSNISQFLKKLKDQGWYIVGADLDTDLLYNQVEYKFPLALIIGNEGEGLHRIVKQECDILVKIPKFGKVDSLNLSVALGILIYKIRESK
ncbi:MAG: 23S rRNA (guanosine(2251)-2'-O)-methyltransferase RlmB [Dictyoglomaceae bacterium]|nr:23S rRNA (guanosine(2251)-2'-O)-methyltransferase RlmB [Dictyoglomaceae bacterium]